MKTSCFVPLPCAKCEGCVNTFNLSKQNETSALHAVNEPIDDHKVNGREAFLIRVIWVVGTRKNICESVELIGFCQLC